jgi:hypothetical protein
MPAMATSARPAISSSNALASSVGIGCVGSGGGAAANGVTALELADAGPVPAAFDAATVHEYVTPLVSPWTTMGLATPLAVVALPPADGVQATT